MPPMKPCATWCVRGQRRAGIVQGPPASAKLLAAPRPDLSRGSGLDTGPPPLADDGPLCPSGAADRAAGLHPRRAGRRSPARPADAANRRALARLVDGTGVTALQAMRGVALVVAVTVVAEVGDFRRFANAR